MTSTGLSRGGPTGMMAGMRSVAFTSWVAVVLLAACSSRESTRSGEAGGGVDSGRTDGGEVVDSGGFDASGTDAGDGGSGAADAGDDASNADASGGGGDAATGGCGDLGKPCSSAEECGEGLECHGSGVCLREGVAICGGFAGATCPSEAPHCYYCSGCDFGPCLTTEEVACVCAPPGAGARFTDCS